jgi:hypothetical protein
MDKDLQQKIATTMARHVEWTAELARQFGFPFPKEYDFGLRIIEHADQRDGIMFLRINNITYRRKVLWPQAGMAEVDRFAEELVRVAGELVHHYIDTSDLKIPDAKIEGLKSAIADGRWEDKIEERANWACSTASYETR